MTRRARRAETRLPLPLACALLLIFAYYAWITLAIFPPWPVDFDEFGYYHQARLFTEGRMKEPLFVPHPRLLEPHMLYFEGGVFSKYPPGMAMMLAPFLKAGIPKLANPAAMVLGLFFLFHILRRIASEREALVLVLLVGFSPYSIGYAASLHSVALSFCLTAAAFLAFLSFEETKERQRLYLLGLAAGLGFLVRPVDFVIVCASISAGFCYRWRMEKALRYMVRCWSVAAVGLLLLVLYNYAQSGRWSFLMYYHYFASHFETTGRKAVPFLEALTTDAKDYMDTARIVLPVLFFRLFVPLAGAFNVAMMAAGFAGLKARPLLFIFPLHLALLIVVYNLNNNEGWSLYGARYWFSGLGSMAVLALLGWRAACAWAGRKPRRQYITLLLVGALLAYNLGRVGPVTERMLNLYQQRFQSIANARANLEAACPEGSLVILEAAAPYRGRDFYVQDIFQKQNSFTGKKRIMIHDFQKKGFEDGHVTDMPVLPKIQAHYPDLTICRHRIDYRPPK